MRDLQKYAAECMLILDRLKIKYSKNVRFAVNSRAVSRLGLCRRENGGYVIEIAAVLLDERVDAQRGLKDTLLHELLHTCRGCMKHTGKWKELAERVNAECGTHVSRAVSPELIPPQLRPKPAYTVRCEGCGFEVTRQKRSALIAHPENYRCPKCRGKLFVAQG